MSAPMFSILIVSLNPGDKLVETVESVARQTYTDYEVIVKDGGSRDGSVERLRNYLHERDAMGCGRDTVRRGRDTVRCGWDTVRRGQDGIGRGQDAAGRVRILEQPDTGIYDGMNQATREARGEYLYFLNCGDTLFAEDVLAQAAAEIEKYAGHGAVPKIYYGDIYDALRGQVVASNPHIDDFACYRNVPCHQACIYHHSLFAERGYEPGYRVRADYEHFLWCYFRREARPGYIEVVLASYEGGGFSETPENRRRSAQEHGEITALYMGRAQRLKYRLLLLATLAPLRTRMAESPAWSGLYNRCKKLLYRR